MCIIFIGSSFIDNETCPQMCQKMFSGMYPNRTYGFSPPTGLWRFVARVLVFVISHIVINKLIGFKAVTKVIQVLSCVGKCRPKRHKVPLG